MTDETSSEPQFSAAPRTGAGIRDRTAHPDASLPPFPTIPSQPTRGSGAATGHRVPVHIIAQPAEPQVHPGQTIAAVERALDVLLLFGTLGRGDLGVTEISSEIGMSKAAVHRVLSSLRSRGLVVLDTTTHRYSLGAASLSLGRAYLEQLDVRRHALPSMTSLAEDLGETMLLSVRTNDQQVFVEQSLPQREIRTQVPVGIPIPLHAGSAGKVFLAHGDDEAVDDYIERRGLEALTDITITDADALRAEVATVRAQGFATSLGERATGVASIAAPILDDQGRPAAVLVIAGPGDRIRSRLPELAAPLLDTTSRLSQRMGWISPTP